MQSGKLWHCEKKHMKSSLLMKILLNLRVFQYKILIINENSYNSKYFSQRYWLNFELLKNIKNTITFDLRILIQLVTHFIKKILVYMFFARYIMSSLMYHKFLISKKFTEFSRHFWNQDKHSIFINNFRLSNQQSES